MASIDAELYLCCHTACMYLSVDVGGVIKHFMADSAGLRSCCKR